MVSAGTWLMIPPKISESLSPREPDDQNLLTQPYLIVVGELYRDQRDTWNPQQSKIERLGVSLSVQCRRKLLHTGRVHPREINENRGAILSVEDVLRGEHIRNRFGMKPLDPRRNHHTRTGSEATPVFVEGHLDACRRNPVNDLLPIPHADWRAPRTPRRHQDGQCQSGPHEPGPPHAP